jgi:hypothetical protein
MQENYTMAAGGAGKVENEDREEVRKEGRKEGRD